LVVQGVGQSETNMHIKVFFTKAGFMSQAVPDLPIEPIGLKIYGASGQGA
jgi:hypothetical protein